MKYSQFLLPLFISLVLTACSISFIGDITPPPGSQQLPLSRSQPPSASGSVFPLVPPNPENGRTIYLEKCAPCHGLDGHGGGPKANELPNPVSAIGSIDLARQAKPAYWYTIVTRGNLELFMPPFISLSDRQRWDVVAYALSLGVSAESVFRGSNLYQEYCASCHGIDGKGNGPKAANLSKAPANLTDLAFMANRSAVDLYRTIAVGFYPDMPAFGDRLEEDDIWALTDFLRSLTFTLPEQASIQETTETPLIISTPESIPTMVITPTQGLGSVTGRVFNGSGGDLPANLSVTLHGFDDIQAVLTSTTTIRSDGSFIFKEVEMLEGLIYIATTEFEGMVYASDIGIVPPNAHTLDLPITIYNTTTDPSIITIDRLHMFFELLDENRVRVVELYIMSNPTNKTLVPSAEGQPTIRFKLPVGSQNLKFEDSVLGERYLETPDGFGDTLPIRPGSGNHQVLFAFEMPYERRLELVQPVSLPIEAVVILVPEGSIRITSSMLADDGIRDMQGTQYHLYSGGSFAPGEELRLIITGRFGESVSIDAGSRNNLLIGVGFFGCAVIIAGVWFYQQKRAIRLARVKETHEGFTDSTTEDVETVMDAILALDDLFQAGELPEKAYRQRRSELKTQLEGLIRKTTRG